MERGHFLEWVNYFRFGNVLFSLFEFDSLEMKEVCIKRTFLASSTSGEKWQSSTLTYIAGLTD